MYPLTKLQPTKVERNSTRYCGGQPAISELVGSGHIKRFDLLNIVAIELVTAKAPVRPTKSRLRDNAPLTLPALKAPIGIYPWVRSRFAPDAEVFYSHRPTPESRPTPEGATADGSPGDG